MILKQTHELVVCGYKLVFRAQIRYNARQNTTLWPQINMLWPQISISCTCYTYIVVTIYYFSPPCHVWDSYAVMIFSKHLIQTNLVEWKKEQYLSLNHSGFEVRCIQKMEKYGKTTSIKACPWGTPGRHGLSSDNHHPGGVNLNLLMFGACQEFLPAFLAIYFQQAAVVGLSWEVTAFYVCSTGIVHQQCDLREPL